MKGKKTINVDAFKSFANTQLARTDEHATESFKEGICVALEKVLRMSGNYNGYNDLYWNEIGWYEWKTVGKETEVWEEKKVFMYGTPDSKYHGNKFSRLYY